MSYSIAQVFPNDFRTLAQIDALLKQEGIERDKNLDYICAMFDDEFHVIATASCFGNTLRCFAVDHLHQGEGLLNEILSHLIEVEAARGYIHLFLYTKPSTAEFFKDLGFFEIARVPGKLVFMENRRSGFSSYLFSLSSSARPEGVSAAIVMNANPFTLGHQYLVETAAAQCDTLHLFVVSEDASLVPASIRRQLVAQGVEHLRNVFLHDCGPYMISIATFPSYFLKDSETVIESQAQLDLQIFLQIAERLHLQARYVGEEPTSQVTSIYNRVMSEQLAKAGIACHIIPRKELDGRAISASTARKCLQQGDLEGFRRLVPESTWQWFVSADAAPVLERIRSEKDVVHY